MADAEATDVPPPAPTEEAEALTTPPAQLAEAESEALEAPKPPHVEEEEEEGMGGELIVRRVRSKQPTTDMRARFITQKSVKIEAEYNMIRTPIARGGYGVVFTATDKRTKEVRAVKAMLKDKVKDIPALEREIDLTKNMDHPNIVKLFASFVDEKYIYLVMEMCEGGELFKKISEARRFSEPLVMKLMSQIFRAVCYMHKQGIVHRDIKPENFLLLTKEPLEKNTLKLIDFGFSKHVSEGEQLDAMVGSVFYVAPEVIEQSYGKASDIWSCGVMMYMMLSGAPPFTGTSDHVVLQKVKKGEYRLHGALWDPVSEEGKDFIRKILVLNQDERIKAENILEHPWFHRDAVVADKAGLLDPGIVQNLRSFGAASRFRQAALIAVAHQLKEKEVEDLRKAFISIDKDGDGSITLDEMRLALSELPTLLSDPELDQIMSEMDVNHDGTVSYTEFLASAMDQRIQDREDRLRMAFKAFDLDNDGVITLRELREVLKDDTDDYGAIADEVFRQMDTLGTGRATFEQFKALVKLDAASTAA
mmetsp:Transcript_66678/g.117926  ORF Transcript_66678/g.117926 Transcript_66678/m.117926 type:complete len:534 (+) Transcript_66678:29-1630(+)|eukprot:CAMPEP_0197637044 /NCGR_PEP_ID=MMETSP1338-20131121/12387_1 /TAXON_ID=43686 ORGANISM="Pelagodinium beii, Strain RCC1491" /NCGR_SAMPLE_ID=MMETSP1338 /ASSEMBLY_ACC=CAM_ASM_000754 /LENGTH=533 /DNA_ID=CAMNT_0043209403 /DNA_START=22 /DNA_END=1623 /DNA_ORIENTATION=-